MGVTRRGGRALFGRAISYAILITWSVVILFPLYWVVTTSIKQPVDVFTGAKYIPFIDYKPTLSAWQDLFAGKPINIFRPFINSMIIATASSVVALVFGGLAAYGLVRFNYRVGRMRSNDISFTFLSQRLLPPAAIVLSFMVVFNMFHLLDTIPGIALAYVGFNIPLAVWLMLDFFRAVPRELDEAALVDGASWFQTLVRVVVPIAAPGIGATFLLLFIFAWNEYLFAALLSFEQSKTLPVVIAEQATANGIRWWSMSAIATISIVPALVLGVAAERWIVRGLSSGALK
jgi:multiple sugar transport system permease protein